MSGSAAPRTDPPWRRVAVDVLLAALVWIATMAFVIGPREGSIGGGTLLGGLVLAALTAVPILLRRVRPLVMMVLVELATIIQIGALDHFSRMSGFGLAVAVYAVAAYASHLTSQRVAAGLIVLNSGLILGGWLFGEHVDAGNLVVDAVLVGGSWAAGDNVRTRRAYLASLEDRAQRLEREREENARRAVLDERAHIARELHDVVAHHVSAIAVQAGAAEEIALRDPESARQALGSIQSTSRQALTEMRALVGVLKSGDGDESPLAPQPGLEHLDQLLDRMRGTGIEVRLATAGRPRPLPPGLDLSAYRIVQEALTNVLKHSGVRDASVSVTYGRDAIELLIDDAGRGAPGGPSTGGRGLVGMRERVALFGGELDTGGKADGGFRVRARIPLEVTE